jgi:hypothetical protein
MVACHLSSRRDHQKAAALTSTTTIKLTLCGSTDQADTGLARDRRGLGCSRACHDWQAARGRNRSRQKRRNIRIKPSSAQTVVTTGAASRRRDSES